MFKRNETEICDSAILSSIGYLLKSYLNNIKETSVLNNE